MSFQGHLKLFKLSFPLKIDQSVSNLLLCSLFIFALNSTKIDLMKYPKESLQKIVQENSWYAKKCPVFGISGFLCIHACALNDNLELLENFYFSPE